MPSKGSLREKKVPMPANRAKICSENSESTACSDVGLPLSVRSAILFEIQNDSTISRQKRASPRTSKSRNSVLSPEVCPLSHASVMPNCSS